MFLISEETYGDHDLGPKAKRSLDFKTISKDSSKLSPSSEAEPLLNNSFLSQYETDQMTPLPTSQQNKSLSNLGNGQEPVSMFQMLTVV